MMMKSVCALGAAFRRGFPWLVALLVAIAPGTATACSVCYGEPDSPAARGLTWAILALILVVAVVLTGLTAFFVHASRNTLAMESVASEER